MNQQIIFPAWGAGDEKRKALRLDVQQAGLLIPCYIPFSVLQEYSKEVIDEEQTANAVFQQQSLYFEDKLEAAIESEDFTSSGEIWIS